MAKYVINSSSTDLQLSKNAIKMLKNLKQDFKDYDYEIERTDKDLITIVETLGEKASSCELEVCEYDEKKFRFVEVKYCGDYEEAVLIPFISKEFLIRLVNNSDIKSIMRILEERGIEIVDRQKTINTIELIVDEPLTKLAGYDLGKDVFKKSLNMKIDYTENITVIIPEYIEIMSSSFIKGFFEELVINMGIRGIEERVNIVSSISNIKNIIVDDL